MLFLGSHPLVLTGEGPMIVTSRPELLWYVSHGRPLLCKRTGCPAISRFTQTLTNPHISTASQGVISAQHSVAIKQVGRKDKRACFAYNMRAHAAQIPIYRLHLFKANMRAVLQLWEIHRASVAVSVGLRRTPFKQRVV